MSHSVSRRGFLRNTSLALAGSTLMPLDWNLELAKMKHLGLQLWSVRADMAKDPKGTIEALSKMGYREVEGFGFNDGKMFGLPYSDFKSLLKDNGIKMPSAHFNLTMKDYDTQKKDITDRVKIAIDAAVKMKQKYVINPYMDATERNSIKELIPLYSATAKYCKQAGVRFGYHNHDFEYTIKGPDGRLLIEWLLTELDPSLTTMQMDIYWVAFAGQKPLDWINRYPGRWELCHAKDMAKDGKHESIEVGDGSIDFASIFAQSKKAGLKHYVVELEHYVTTPMKGVDRSLQAMKKIKF